MTNERQDLIFSSYFWPWKTNLILVLFFFSFIWDTSNCKESLLQQRDSDSENTWKNEVSLSRAINFHFLFQELSTDVVLQCVSILIRKWANNFLLSSPLYFCLFEAEMFTEAKSMFICHGKWQYRRQYVGQ